MQQPETCHDAWEDEDFIRALADPDHPVPNSLSKSNGSSAGKRFSIYRNNVIHSLKQALADIYPATAFLAGANKFSHVARLYIDQSPPQSRILSEYGQDFPDFLNSFAPARTQMPWLSHLARLERIWLNAWHASDMLPIQADQLATLASEQIETIRFVPHPAAMALSAPFAIADLFEAGRNHRSADPYSSQSVLVTRPELAVILTPLEGPGFIFAEQLLSGQTLSRAADAAHKADETADIGLILGRLFHAGAFTGIKA